VKILILVLFLLSLISLGIGVLEETKRRISFVSLGLFLVVLAFTIQATEGLQ